MIAQQQYYKSLSGLRGLGAIWVTLFHVFYQSTNHLISVGYLGVDLFFILSGFIISHVHNADFANGYRPAQHWKFLQLRLIRIYPLHVFILFAFALFVFTAPRFVEQHVHPERFGFGPFLASLFLVHNWGFTSTTFWNGPTWSLSAEWLAYLAFPFISVAVGRLNPKYSLLAALVALVSLELILFITMSPRGDMGKVGLLRIGFEFLSGCFIQRYAAWDRRRSTASLEWVALGLLAIAIYIPSLRAFAPISFALLILAVVSGQSIATKLFSSPPMLFLGDVSFSLYMCHWPLIQVRNWSMKQGYMSEGVSLFALLVAICIVTILCWKYVEVPARAFGRQLLRANVSKELDAQGAEAPSAHPVGSEPAPLPPTGPR
jgi:peptidoglycan/LPS O-acetylase OafA/YrhL